MNRLNKVKLWLSEKLTPQGYTIVEKEFEQSNVPVPTPDMIPPEKIPDNTRTVQDQPNIHHTKEGGANRTNTIPQRRDTYNIW